MMGRKLWVGFGSPSWIVLICPVLEFDIDGPRGLARDADLRLPARLFELSLIAA